jgi:hypothetical protein
VPVFAESPVAIGRLSVADFGFRTFLVPASERQQHRSSVVGCIRVTQSVLKRSRFFAIHFRELIANSDAPQTPY